MRAFLITIVALLTTTYLPGQSASYITLSPSTHLTISNAKVTTDHLTMEPGSSLLGNNTLTVTEDATIKQDYSGSTSLTDYMYHLVSIPLQASANPQSGLFMDSYLYSFNTASNGWTNLGNSTTIPLNVTKGYMLYYPESSHTYEFTGQLHSGTFHPTVTYAGQGFNLVPNPYPSAMDWDAAGWTKTNIANAIWLWPAGASNYSAYINGVGTGTPQGTSIIPACQGFFVQATGSNPVLTMTDEVRLHSSQPLWKENPSISNLLRVSVVANGFQDEVVVRFEEGSTSLFDAQFDATKMVGREGAPQLYTLTDDQVGLTINSLPVSVKNSEVKMAYESSVSGDATLTVSGTASFNPNTTIYLDDLLTGKSTDLNVQNSYSFHHTVGNDAARFKLRFNGVTGLEEVSEKVHHIWIYDNMLYIHSPELMDETLHVELFNLLGQQIYTTTILGGELTKLQPKVQGVVVVRVTSDHSVYTFKGYLN